MLNSNAAMFFKNIKKYQKDIQDDFEVPLIIKPKLLFYQRRAVKWMIHCEKDNKMITSNGSKFCGGILADEMGLGKTVEMLCCIVANTAPTEFYYKKIEINDFQTEAMSMSFATPSTSKYIPYTGRKDLDKLTRNCSRSMLNNWYNEILNEMSATSSKNSKSQVQRSFDKDVVVGCYCVKTPPNKTLVFCAKCGKGQHAECVKFNLKPFQEVPYLCANCWIVNDKLHCKATLVVVPQSILNQWIDEIKKHIENPGLKIFVYNGVHFDGYIQPITFNDYDIVITSYNNLSRDLNFVDDFDCDKRNATRLRHSKKYYYPKSPLPCIKWWRICLDEGQAVESVNCKVFEMTSCLESVNKWVMTGTPIQKSLYDLYGILKFLNVNPYCDNKQFQQLLNGDPDYMYSWFSNIIWRNLVEDVNFELSIPEITHEQHMLTISQIEKHFYDIQHGDCSNAFEIIINKLFSSLNISVKEIDKRTIYKILAPLYKLRQACVHPQAVNGWFLTIKGTMTMEKLMDVMIEKCRTECNDILRGFVSDHNALAGLYLIRGDHISAVTHYAIVLGLLKKYADKKLKIDTSQRIHVMYNLASVLDEQGHGICPDEINAVDLKNDMEQLEKKYLDSSKQSIENTRKTVTLYSNKIRNLIGKKTIAYSEWWSDMLDWIYSPSDFLTKLRAELEDYRVPGVPNIANRLKSTDDVYNMLGAWLANLDSTRNNTLSLLEAVEEIPMNDLVLTALTCHLRLKSKNLFTKKKCLLCQAEYELLKYESLLFCVSNKLNNMSAYIDDKKNDEAMYDSTSKGFWKMSQKEFLLTKLFQYGQAKIINENCLKDAAEHMKILELVRKEFRYLRLLWADLSDSLSAHDEIVMAKSRLRLGDPIKPESDETGPPNKKTKTDKDNDVVLEQYVDYNVISLISNITMTEAKLVKQIGTLQFLENIKKETENSTEIEPCPICQYSSDSGWAVLECGHSICDECFTTMCSHHSRDTFEITCPLCRSDTHICRISCVKTIREGELPSTVIKGSFSTKIESITLKLLELIAKDPLVKVIVFSTWDKALSLLGEALDQNSINYRVLKNGNKYKKTLTDFKTNEKINALLMQLSLGSKGLNLTEATRIFFMEPIINKADEHQAIGRIYRIGQTKPTFVHHFVIRDTIEENIVKLFAADQLHDWKDITISQLISVFEKN